MPLCFQGKAPDFMGMDQQPCIISGDTGGNIVTRTEDYSNNYQQIPKPKSNSASLPSEQSPKNTL